jgi:hypothetical protein
MASDQIVIKMVEYFWSPEDQNLNALFFSEIILPRSTVWFVRIKEEFPNIKHKTKG